MGKKINTRHKNFLADLQALMKKRYQVSREGYTEQDKQREALITGEPVQPVQSGNWRKRSTAAQAAKNKKIKEDAVKFEAEYEAFIKALKSKKEKTPVQSENANPETVVTTEPVLDTEQIVTTVPEEPVAQESLPTEQPTRRRHLRRININEQNESPAEEKKEEEFDPFAEF